MAATAEQIAKMSHFLQDDIPWEAQTDKSRRKIIRLDDNIYVALIQWDAGFTLGHLDKHEGEETVYVVSGTFRDESGDVPPGSIVRGDPGSAHRPGTPDGVTFFVVRSLAPGERQRINVPKTWQRPTKARL